MIFDNTFLHFFDLSFLKERRGMVHPAILKEMEYGLILSLLFSKTTFIPISSYIESQHCQNIIKKYLDLFDFGIITFVGGNSTIDEYIEDKLIQYPNGSPLEETYKKYRDSRTLIPYHQKKGSSSNNIKNEWLLKLNNFDESLNLFNYGFSSTEIDMISNEWEMVPERIEEKAFIVEHVIPVLDKRFNSNIILKNELYRIINKAYFRHYIKSLDSAIISNMVYLNSEEINLLTDKLIPYGPILEIINSDYNKYGHLLNTDKNQLLINRQNNVLTDIYLQAVSKNKLEMIANKKIYDLNVMKKTNHVKVIGIITALIEEYTAMRLMIEDESVPDSGDDPNDYITGFITTNQGRKIKIIIALLKEMGTNNAASVTVNLIRSYTEIDQIIMTGIAGGIPNINKPKQHVRLGDVVVINNDGLIQYDNLKIDSKTIMIRSKSPKPSSLFIGKSRVLLSNARLGNRPWEKHIERALNKIRNVSKPSSDVLRINGDVVDHPFRENKQLEIHLGKIGCSNTLLKNEELRDKLSEQHNVLAIEMEASGVSDGTWSCDKEYFVVRGIVDYCNDDKNDDWHEYSAICAAAVTKSLIEML